MRVTRYPSFGVSGVRVGRSSTVPSGAMPYSTPGSIRFPSAATSHKRSPDSFSTAILLTGHDGVHEISGVVPAVAVTFRSNGQPLVFGGSPYRRIVPPSPTAYTTSAPDHTSFRETSVPDFMSAN